MLLNSSLALLALAALAPKEPPLQSEGAPLCANDWVVPPGTFLVINTVTDEIQLGDIFGISATRTITGGLIDVEDVLIGEGARVRFEGPNPVTIIASGDVSIDGELSVSGASALDVQCFGGPRPGAQGHAGGGDGGSGTTSVTATRGGRGEAAFGRPNGGGRGGESGFHPTSKRARRGAGGGGGLFGPDILYPLVDSTGVERDVPCQTRVGMDAEPGFPGGQLGAGAVNQPAPAAGGRAGGSPFQDSSSVNDFFGVARTLQGLVVGELDRPWAGAGGGAGGNAVRAASYPNPAFPDGEEDGGAGGGGGGSITILAQGTIHVREEGSIRADGGRGGPGENTSFLDRVGGGGGGGSGGHIILSASSIVVWAVAENAGSDYQDPSIPGASNDEHPRRPISAIGGQGAAGRDNEGGGTSVRERVWKCDAIPLDRLTLFGLSIPPLEEACFQSLGVPGLPTGTVVGAGGDGGPGLIQLHAPDPEQNIHFIDPDATRSFMPRPLGWRDGSFSIHLLPLSAPELRELARQRAVLPDDQASSVAGSAGRSPGDR